jgi:hypothetical protein
MKELHAQPIMEIYKITELLGENRSSNAPLKNHIRSSPFPTKWTIYFFVFYLTTLSVAQTT